MSESTEKRLKIAQASGKEKTVGQIAVEEKLKAPDPYATTDAIREQAQKDYIDQLAECVKTHEKMFPDDFFVVVDTKREKVLDNVIRNYFYGRRSCPTPNYDQSVFMFHKESGDLEYIWTVPSRDACFHLLERRLELNLEEKELLVMVQAFASGKLMQMCKSFNNEYEEEIRSDDGTARS
jgi:hypothetical protein